MDDLSQQYLRFFLCVFRSLYCHFPLMKNGTNEYTQHKKLYEYWKIRHLILIIRHYALYLYHCTELLKIASYLLSILHLIKRVSSTETSTFWTETRRQEYTLPIKNLVNIVYLHFFRAGFLLDVVSGPVLVPCWYWKQEPPCWCFGTRLPIKTSMKKQLYKNLVRSPE